MPDTKLTTVMVDGLTVETTDAGAQAISKLTKALSDAQEAKTTADQAHSDALKTKDTELAAKDAEIEKLKGSQLSDEDLDKRVKDRADLISTAKVIADVDYTGKSDGDIRKAAVVAKLGQDSVKDKSDDYIAARFDILAEDASADPVRKNLMNKNTNRPVTADAAYDEYVASLQNGTYHTPQKEAH